MIKDKVVFILGAGASVPFGFPTGTVLVEDILKIRKENVPSRLNGMMCESVCQKMGFDEWLMKDMQIALRQSQASSIDEFLAQPVHQRFVEIGRFLIAALLIPKEDPNHLFAKGDGANRNWYQLLWGHLKGHASMEALLKDAKVTIVTFNYDRSLEHYLMSVFRFHWEAQSAKGAEFLANNVFHVHGMLGGYRHVGGGPSRPYSTACDLEIIRRAMLGIKVVHEVDEYARQAEIKERIENADRLVFLGFQHHSENLRRLLKGLRKRNPRLKVLSSCFGLSNMECGAARRQIAEFLNIDVKAVDIGDAKDLGCYDYLREYFETD